jgi:hypothetical protein
MEKGETDREHRDTGRQRSEPEEGKHARQPEGRAGERGVGRGDRPGRLERGGPGTGGQASESRPIPDGAFLKPVSGGRPKAGCTPPVAARSKGGYSAQYAC